MSNDPHQIGVEVAARWLTRRRGFNPDAPVYYREHSDGTKSRVDARNDPPEKFDGVMPAWRWFGLHEASELISVYQAASARKGTGDTEPNADLRDGVAGFFFWPMDAAKKNTDNASIFDVLAAIRDCAASWQTDARIIGNVRAGDIVRALDGVWNELDLMHRSGKDMSWAALKELDATEETVWIVRRAYDWAIDTEYRIWGLVSGDQGYAATNIVLRPEDLP